MTTTVSEIEGEERVVTYDAAKQLERDPIIMGTHGWTGAARALICSVAVRVVRTTTYRVWGVS